MNLYEISNELNKALINGVDSDGCIIEGFESLIDELSMAKEEKLINCALYIKNETAFCDMLKLEEESLSARRKAIEKRIEWMKKYVLSHIEEGKKIESHQALISTRKSESIEILNEELIPKELCKHIPESYKADKSLIKKALKAGNEIEGAKIVKNLNLQIK